LSDLSLVVTGDFKSSSAAANLLLPEGEGDAKDVNGFSLGMSITNIPSGLLVSEEEEGQGV
jgi:hypothetical protein